ncbi:hypothetical protein L2E82_12886 [Cichorium intybus]|uniref:Uncharacterized protein n=1 Tax=Cichorium intybus TaxID=13427 RepID=A0ACB9GGS4_CICIN|nr:hypothetical protein L2E82_12886 [Cichorium intybus]
MYETESSTATMGNGYFLSLKEVFHPEFLTLSLVHPRYYTELQDSDFCFVKTGEMETSSMNYGEETSMKINSWVGFLVEDKCERDDGLSNASAKILFGDHNPR